MNKELQNMLKKIYCPDNFDDSKFTNDYVILEEARDITIRRTPVETFAKATDYALACGGSANFKADNKQISGNMLLRSKTTARGAYVDMANVDGLNYSVTTCNVKNRSGIICPMIRVSPEVFSFFSPLGNVTMSHETKMYGDKKIKLDYIEFEKLAYPQSVVDDPLKTTLFTLFKEGKLNKTGRKFVGYTTPTGEVLYNYEFEYEGNRYVLGSAKPVETNYYFSNGENIDNHFYFFKVEPIRFIVRNWDKLPKTVNANGDGSAKSMLLRTEKGIVGGMPFNADAKGANQNRFQNSFVRAYLNGYNIKQELKNHNGIERLIGNTNYDFTGRGLLDEAFLSETALSHDNTTDYEEETDLER